MTVPTKAHHQVVRRVDKSALVQRGTGRRSVLGLLSTGGMALVGGLAGVFGAAEPAAADCQGSPCCSLARCERCSGRCWNFNCPAGYHRQYWYCAAGARFIGCGECTTSSTTCWQGSFNCSIWWDDATC